MTRWNEGEHPRGKGGKFATKPAMDADGSVTLAGVDDVAAERARYDTHPSPALRNVLAEFPDVVPVSDVTEDGRVRTVATLSDDRANGGHVTRFFTYTTAAGALDYEVWQASNGVRAVELQRFPFVSSGRGPDDPDAYMGGLELRSAFPMYGPAEPAALSMPEVIDGDFGVYMDGSSSAFQSYKSSFTDPRASVAVVEDELVGRDWPEPTPGEVEQERSDMAARRAGAAWADGRGVKMGWSGFEAVDRVSQFAVRHAREHGLDGLADALDESFMTGDLFDGVRERTTSERRELLDDRDRRAVDRARALAGKLSGEWPWEWAL